MKYVLEICHPNDFVWKITDHLDSWEGSFDYLRFPSFEVYDYMLARFRREDDCITDEYVFDGADFLSIKNSASILKFDYDHEGNDLSQKSSLSELWIEHTNPMLFLSALVPRIPTRDNVRIALAFAKYVDHYVPKEDPRSSVAMDLCEKWLNGEMSIKRKYVTRFGVIQQFIAETKNTTYTHAAQCAMEAFSGIKENKDWNYAAANACYCALIMESGGVSNDYEQFASHAKANVLGVLRQHLAFYDVCAWIFKK